jgi:Putative viral replication protein
MSQSRAWCFTVNNYTETEVLLIRGVLASDDVIYGIVALEVSREGTPHLQGFGYFT